MLLILTSCSTAQKTVIASQKMQQMVIDISKEAKKRMPNFSIIPQNGLELLYNEIDVSKGFNTNYLRSIDGVGIEILHYNKKYTEDVYRQRLLQDFPKNKIVLSSEYVENLKDISNAKKINKDKGYLPFIRDKNNLYYKYIPKTIANQNNISKLTDVKNYLYLINPDNYSTKEAFLKAMSHSNYDLLLIDMFYNETPLTKGEVEYLKVKKNGKKRQVIAYMNIGAAETYRYYWQKEWTKKQPKWFKKQYKGYEDEYWVEFWNPTWQQIIYKSKKSYLNKILDRNFDGVYLDNVEAYYTLYHK